MTSASPEKADLQKLVEQLESKSFSERVAATKKLREAGQAAIAPLKEALTKAGVEQRARIQSILNHLEQSSFAETLATLEKDPGSALIEQLPEWKRFAQIVGSTPEDRRFYLRLLRSEKGLFTVAAKDIRGVRTPLRSRAAEVLQQTRDAVRKSQNVNLDQYAALILLAGNPALLLRGDTSTSLNSVLLSPAFERCVASPDGSRFLKLVGAYIQRSNIAVVDPLRFARKFKTPEGLVLARRVLKSVLRGVDGQMALIVIQEQGDESDLPLVESLFEHPGLLAEGRRTRVNATQSYTATNGDLALAVACSLRGEDPRDYGFSRVDNVGEDFRFALDTIGFTSEADRARSRELYRDRWLTEPSADQN